MVKSRLIIDRCLYCESYREYKQLYLSQWYNKSISINYSLYECPMCISQVKDMSIVLRYFNKGDILKLRQLQ